MSEDEVPNQWPGSWQLDEHKCWILRRAGVFIWIEPRPSYCDRGHWKANVDGIASIDGADAFPRYYMDLERAKLEMSEWLDWRLKCERQNV